MHSQTLPCFLLSPRSVSLQGGREGSLHLQTYVSHTHAHTCKLTHFNEIPRCFLAEVEMAPFTCLSCCGHHYACCPLHLSSYPFSFFSPWPGFPAAAYGPVAAAAVAAARGSGRGGRGRGGYMAYPQNAGPGKSSVGILCGCSYPSCSPTCVFALTLGGG